MATGEQLTEGEELIQLYVNAALARSMSIEEAPDLLDVLGHEADAVGLEVPSGIGELPDSQLVRIGAKSLRAYFAKKEELQACDRRQARQDAADHELREFLWGRDGRMIRVTQVKSETPQLSLPRGREVSTVAGKLIGFGYVRPYDYLRLYPKGWLLTDTDHEVIVNITRGNDPTPYHRVEFL